MPERTRAQMLEIALGWRCPDCDVPLLVNPHLGDCAGVAALNDSWTDAFPKRADDPLGIRTMPSPWVAFERGWWAGRIHESEQNNLL